MTISFCENLELMHVWMDGPGTSIIYIIVCQNTDQLKITVGFFEGYQWISYISRLDLGNRFDESIENRSQKSRPCRNSKVAADDCRRTSSKERHTSCRSGPPGFTTFGPKNLGRAGDSTRRYWWCNGVLHLCSNQLMCCSVLPPRLTRGSSCIGGADADCRCHDHRVCAPSSKEPWGFDPGRSVQWKLHSAQAPKRPEKFGFWWGVQPKPGRSDLAKGPAICDLWQELQSKPRRSETASRSWRYDIWLWLWFQSEPQASDPSRQHPKLESRWDVFQEDGWSDSARQSSKLGIQLGFQSESWERDPARHFAKLDFRLHLQQESGTGEVSNVLGNHGFWWDVQPELARSEIPKRSQKVEFEFAIQQEPGRSVLAIGSWKLGIWCDLQPQSRRSQLTHQPSKVTGWWFHMLFFTPTWDDDPIWNPSAYLYNHYMSSVVGYIPNIRTTSID